MADTNTADSSQADGEAPPARRRDGPATRRAILDAALAEFSDHGLTGARVDAIVARSGANVRMIYYYFGSKEGLYRAVLAQSYGDMRDAERALDLGALPPREAIAALCRFVFDYHQAHPRFSRLVSIENIHEAAHLRACEGLEDLNVPMLRALDGILARGRAEGLFCADASPLDVHLLMTSFCFFRVANRATLHAVFGVDTLAPERRDAQRRMLTEAVLGYLQAPLSRAERPAAG